MANWENILTGIGYGLNFLGSMGSNVWNNAISNNANEQQERLQDKANAFSLDMWNKENAYNHPSAQMERLKQAGINPAIAYANGVQNTAGGAPSSVQPNDVHRAKMENPFSDFDKLAIDVSEAKLNEEKANLTAKEVEKTGKEIILTEKISLRVGEEVKLTSAQIDETRKRLERINGEIEVLRSKVSNIDQDTYLKWNQAQAQDFVNKYNSAVAGIRFQKESFEAKVARVTALKIASDIALNGSIIEVNNSQVKINGQILRGLEFENDFNDKTLQQQLDMVGVQQESGRLQLQLNKAEAGLKWEFDEHGKNIIGLNGYGYLTEGLESVGTIFSGNVTFYRPFQGFGHKVVKGFGR